jgi:hypothetical protein
VYAADETCVELLCVQFMFDEFEPYVVCEHSFHCFLLEFRHADAMLDELGFS